MTAKAQAVYAKVRKPPEGVASKLREMFPSSGGMVPQKRPSSVFDPLNKCVAESQKRKKSGNYSEAETTECYSSCTGEVCAQGSTKGGKKETQ